MKIQVWFHERDIERMPVKDLKSFQVALYSLKNPVDFPNKSIGTLSHMVDHSLAKKLRVPRMNHLLTEACTGNPGAVSVLVTFLSFKNDFTEQLCKHMIITATQGSDLWIVHKDICKFDILVTFGYLSLWLKYDMPLNEYIEYRKKELQSAERI